MRSNILKGMDEIGRLPDGSLANLKLTGTIPEEI